MKKSYLLKKRGNESSPHKKRDSSHSFGMTNDAVISTEGRNLSYQKPLGYPGLLRRYKSRLVKIVFFVSFSILFFPNILHSEEKPWPLEECITCGLKNHPGIEVIQGNLTSTRAQNDQAKATVKPQLSLSSSFSRQRQEYRRNTSGFAGSTDDLIDSTASSLALRQTISDWGRTKSKVRAGKSTINSVNAEKTWKMIQIAGEIKSSFFKVLQAQSLLMVQRETLKQFQEHLQKVESLVEVGSKPPYDVTKAQVDVANTKVSLIKAENFLRTAQANLTKSIGYNGETPIDLQASFPLPILPPLEKDDLLEEAFQRPDLVASRYLVESNIHRLTGIRKGLSPTLSGNASYDFSGSVSPLNRSWDIRLGLSVPILDGNLSKYQISDAKGSILSANARLELLEQSVRAETDIVIANLQDAFQRLEATETLLKQAREAMELAKGRYDAGMGSPIEVTDARVALSSAEGNRITAFFDSYIALSQLDQVLGRFPKEIEQPATVPKPN